MHMKKCKEKAGLTLIETLVAVSVLVFLILGIDMVMNGALRSYRESVFQSDSAILSGIINTAIGNELLISDEVHAPTSEDPVDADFILHNAEQITESWEDDEYFHLIVQGRPDCYIRQNDSGRLELIILKDGYEPQGLVSTGAYPDLKITSFESEYVTEEDDPQKGGYVHVTYTIESTTLENHTRSEEYFYRLDVSQTNDK